MIVPINKKRGGLERKGNIISSILNSNRQGVIRILSEDANSINAVHEDTGMNAVMVAAYGRLDLFISDMSQYADHLDFRHRDKKGRELLAVALASLHPPTIQAVQGLYEQHGLHIINNWPSP